MKLDPFTTGYLRCALWSSVDEDGRPLDACHDLEDIDTESVHEAAEVCAYFQRDNAADLATVAGVCEARRAGWLFWLNRNGHGAGFWDEYFGPEEAIREAFIRLDVASRMLPESCAVVGDDGRVYLT